MKILQMTLERLKTMQQMPLEDKIQTTNMRINEWYDYWYGNVCVSFSGGLDSSVLLDLVRKQHSEVPAICVAALECRNNQKIIRQMENIIILKPKYSKIEIIKKFGYPIGSKKIAKQITQLQNPSPKNAKIRNLSLTGYTSTGNYAPRYKLAKRWLKLINSKFKVSNKCCYYMKEKPLKEFRKETESAPYVGTIAEESETRLTGYLKTGCNAYSSKGNSTPLGFWTHQDILEYTLKNHLPISEEYGEVKRLDDGTLTTTKAKRTGCFICGFGCHLEKYPNRWQRMQVEDPEVYKFAMETLGYRELLKFLNISYSMEQKPTKR